MSQIHYKFKAAKDYSTIVFDGLSISVFDLKQEILKAKKLNVDEFDVNILNSQTNEEYSDDKALIQRNTSVFVHRIPYSGPPRSSFLLSNKKDSNFSSNKQPIPSSYTHELTTIHSSSFLPGLDSSNPNSSLQENSAHSAADDEKQRIANMFQQSSEQWNYQQNQMEKQVCFLLLFLYSSLSSSGFFIAFPPL
ncbi:putative RING finger protein [Smittium culicis]|uniref:Putative RING finger protein n=1 Tax=Smittium culicis TaxID=133412 RepID=A0A1R1YPS8_9FUNG|nr:putative RING finger protein [Smittium culicis]